MSLEGACLSVYTLQGWQRPLRAGENRLGSLEPNCLAAQGWGGRSFQIGRKALLRPLTAHHPHSRPPTTPALGAFLCPAPLPTPTYLFSFLDFIFHGESSLLLLPPHWPLLHPLPPHNSFVLFPAWSETPPALEFLPLLSDSEQRRSGLDAALLNRGSPATATGLERQPQGLQPEACC